MDDTMDDTMRAYTAWYRARKVEGESDKRAESFRALRLKGLTLKEIGQPHGISPQRVDQIIRYYEHKYKLPNASAQGKAERKRDDK